MRTSVVVATVMQETKTIPEAEAVSQSVLAGCTVIALAYVQDGMTASIERQCANSTASQNILTPVMSCTAGLTLPYDVIEQLSQGIETCLSCKHGL